MAGYSTSSPPWMLVQPIGVGPRIWMYSSVDAASVVRVTGYFTNGATKGGLGMKDGDLLLMYCTASKIWSALTITVSGTTVDCGDATTIGSSTNSD